MHQVFRDEAEWLVGGDTPNETKDVGIVTTGNLFHQFHLVEEVGLFSTASRCCVCEREKVFFIELLVLCMEAMITQCHILMSLIHTHTHIIQQEIWRGIKLADLAIFGNCEVKCQ